MTDRETPAPARPLYLLDSADGLASNQVHRIAADPQDRLWLATPVGLARFDGNFIRHFDRRDGLNCNGLRCVAIDAPGRVWVGTDLGLDLLDQDGQAVPTLGTEAWPFGLCQAIDVSGNDPWLGTAQGLVRLTRRDAGPGYQVAFSADVGFVSEVLQLSARQVLAATAAQGLVQTDGQTWWTYRCQALVGRRVLRLASAGPGRVLVGTDDGVLVLDDADGTVVSRLALADIDPVARAIAAAPDRIWVAFDRHVVAFSSDAKAPQVLEHFVVESPVNDLLADSHGNLWLATNNSGVAKISCLRHAVARIDLGLAGGVYAIKPQPDGRLLLGGDALAGEVRLAPDKRQAALSGPAGLPGTIVWDLHQDDTGTWAATQAGLFHAPPGGPYAPVLPQDPVLGAPNRVLLRRDDGLWVGTLRGLARLRDGQAEAVMADGAPLGYVYALHQDAAGLLWVATLGRGLWREGLPWQAVTDGPLTPDGNTYAISPGPDGRLLVLQDDKVVLMGTDTPARLVAELPPVSGWTALWLDAHTVAIGASDGLRLLDLDQGRVVRQVQCLFRLRDWEFPNNRTLVADAQGRLLCGLSSGLVRVDLAGLKSFAPPMCRLTEIAWTGTLPRRDGEAWVVQPGRWSFRLRAFSAWFVESASLRYQFQLVGFDETWSPPLERPEVSFNSLPPGRYQLMCRATSALAGPGPVAQLLVLRVQRPLWAMGWTVPLAALASWYDKMVGSRSRNEALQQQNQALEQAVAERTDSLRRANQDLQAARDALQRLSESDELTRIGNRRHFQREFDRAMVLAKRLAVPVALLLIDIDHFKAVNDRYGHPQGDAYLQAVARVLSGTVRVGEDTVARYGGEEFAVLLVNSSATTAGATAERIRAGVMALALPNAGAPSGLLTVSVGIAIAGPQGQAVDAETLVKCADQALYRAKAGGRNQVVLGSDPA